MNFGYLFNEDKTWKEFFPDSKTNLNQHRATSWNREQIQQIVEQLQDILTNRNPEIKPKDDFKKNTRTTGTST